ncbi:uncharacterized protein LOC120014227 [Tripterygium wilfordii]|uniref:uncharacterized protein LOC120014227 n=1 Tax=Tripterygium wilfordii TaxID=458696 RepID=UPI0018F7EECF|nr:uncharacterized protein LOC120014227 [Tripterygium wilfordii]
MGFTNYHPGCLLCGNSLDSMKHMLFQCGWVRRAFKEAGVSLPSPTSGNCSIEHWLSKIVEEFSKGQYSRIFTCLWHIWRMRNQILHNNRSFKSEEVGRMMTTFLADYQEAQPPNLHGSSRISQPPIKWRPPQTSVIKINFDAALRDSKVGIGVIARDAEGTHIASKTICVPGPLNPLFAESIAAKEALVFAKSLNYHDVVLEGDSLLVIKALERNEVDLSENGLCVASTKNLLDSSVHVSFSHVKRSANYVADTLAKYALSNYVSHEWLGEKPAFLRHVIETDCLFLSS